MNRITAVLTIMAILSLAIGGCSVSDGQAPSSAAVSASTSASVDTTAENTTSASASIETTAENTTASVTASSPVTTSDFDPEAPERLKENLGASYMYQDIFIPMQFLYISDKKIVIAVFLSGIEQITEIDRSKFSHMEITKTSDFAIVKIFDVSGTVLSISLDSADADEIQSLLG